MEDGDTEKYHPSRVIQDFVFSSRKGVVSGVFLCRYIKNVYFAISEPKYWSQSLKNYVWIRNHIVVSMTRHECLIVLYEYYSSPFAF